MQSSTIYQSLDYTSTALMSEHTTPGKVSYVASSLKRRRLLPKKRVVDSEFVSSSKSAMLDDLMLMDTTSAKDYSILSELWNTDVDNRYDGLSGLPHIVVGKPTQIKKKTREDSEENVNLGRTDKVTAIYKKLLQHHTATSLDLSPHVVVPQSVLSPIKQAIPEEDKKGNCTFISSVKKTAILDKVLIEAPFQNDLEVTTATVMDDETSEDNEDSETDEHGSDATYEIGELETPDEYHEDIHDFNSDKEDHDDSHVHSDDRNIGMKDNMNLKQEEIVIKNEVALNDKEDTRQEDDDHVYDENRVDTHREETCEVEDDINQKEMKSDSSKDEIGNNHGMQDKIGDSEVTKTEEVIEYDGSVKGVMESEVVAVEVITGNATYTQKTYDDHLNDEEVSQQNIHNDLTVEHDTLTTDDYNTATVETEVQEDGSKESGLYTGREVVFEQNTEDALLALNKSDITAEFISEDAHSSQSSESSVDSTIIRQKIEEYETMAAAYSVDETLLKTVHTPPNTKRKRKGMEWIVQDIDETIPRRRHTSTERDLRLQKRLNKPYIVKKVIKENTWHVASD